MKIRTSCIALFAIMMASISAKADEPFRNHRYDAFKAGKVTTESIVFVGNSITNMGSWSETFNDDDRCINRGNSGAVSSETLENIESVLYGHPAKIFLMIGTNDIGSNYAEDIPFNNVKNFIARVRDESPNTDIYLTSVFPSNNGNYRTLAKEESLNTRYKTLVDDAKIHYLDVYEDLMGIISGTISLDRLHIGPAGYKIWCDAVAEISGDATLKSSLIEGSEMTNPTCGQTYSLGMRCQMFCELPIYAKDVLIFGDEMVNGGVWHELLGMPNVKNRGWQWGYGGLPITSYTSILETMLTNDADKITKEKPKQIFFYVGTSELTSSTDAATVKTRYKALLDKAKELMPNTELYILSLTPYWGTNLNNLTKSYNEQLQELATEETGVTYVDLYTPLALANGTPNPEYLPNNYVYGKGYNKIAQILSKYIEGSTVLTDEEFDTQYAIINARNTLGKAVTEAKTALSLESLSDNYKAKLQAQIDEANTMLRGTTSTADEFTAKAETLSTTTAAIENLASGGTDYKETLKSELETIDNNVADLDLGDDLGQYHISYENWDADIAALRAMLADNATNYDEYECAVYLVRLQNAISTASINVPPTGSYIRVKASKNYVSSSASTFNGVQNYLSSTCKQNTVNSSTDYQAVSVNSKTDENEAKTIFYYAPITGSEYGNLVSYDGGRYAYYGAGKMLGFHQGTADTNASVATVVGFQSALAEKGAYHLRYNILNNDIESARVIAITGNDLVVNGGASTSQNLKNYVWSNVELEYVTELPVTIDSDGIAALLFPVAVTVPADASSKFYAATLVDGMLNLHQLSAGTTLSAGTAIIVNGTANSKVRFEIANAIGNDVYVCNNIYGFPALSAYTSSDETTSFAKATSANENTVSFAALSDDIAAYTPVLKEKTNNLEEAYKTTFNVTLQGENIKLRLVTEAGVSSIVVDSANGTKNIYDLQGRKITSPTHGIYIVNGKKIATI